MRGKVSAPAPCAAACNSGDVETSAQCGNDLMYSADLGHTWSNLTEVSDKRIAGEAHARDHPHSTPSFDHFHHIHVIIFTLPYSRTTVWSFTPNDVRWMMMYRALMAGFVDMDWAPPIPGEMDDGKSPHTRPHFSSHLKRFLWDALRGVE